MSNLTFPKFPNAKRASQKQFFAPKAKRFPRAKNAGKLDAAQRTLKWLRNRGWTAEVVEKYIAAPQGSGQKSIFAGGYRKDLFGFADIIAYRPDSIEVGGKRTNILAVQTTSRQQIAPHLRDYRDVNCYVARGSEEQAEKRRKEHGELVDRIRRWIAAPAFVFVIHGWEPLAVPKKSSEGTKVSWELTERIVSESDLIDSKF